MQTLQAFFIWLYAQLLKFYPTEFYTDFAEEMTETFANRLHDADNPIHVAMQEIIELPIAIVRERRQAKYQTQEVSTWLMAAVLLLPVVSGSILLSMRSLRIFFLPGKTWWLFTSLFILIAAFGYIRGQGMMRLALPLLGFVFSVVYRLIWSSTATIFPNARINFMGTDLPIMVLSCIPYLLLIVVLLIYTRYRQAIPSYRWLVYILALPSIGIIIGITEIFAAGTTHLPLATIINRYFLHIFNLPGVLSFIVLLSLPFAMRMGYYAVLILIGFLFTEMIGLVSSLSTSVPQHIASNVYLLMFYFIIPFVILQSKTSKRWFVMGLVVLSYAFLFVLVQIPISVFVPVPPPPVASVWIPPGLSYYVLRISEMLQILIVIAFAFDYYRLIHNQDKAKLKVSDTSTTADTGQELRQVII